MLFVPLNIRQQFFSPAQDPKSGYVSKSNKVTYSPLVIRVRLGSTFSAFSIVSCPHTFSILIQYGTIWNQSAKKSGSLLDV